MDEFLDRKMPSAIEAEQAVLGSILIDPEKSFSTIAELIVADDFYLDAHRYIFDAMKKLFIASKTIDLVTLIDELVSEGVYDKAGAAEYIKNIAQLVPSARNISDYAKIVKDKSTLRRLIDACGEISDTAYTEEGEVDMVVNEAERKIFDIAQKRETKNFATIRDVLLEVYKNLELISNDKSALKGTETGFSGIDRVLVGMGQSDLVLIGARPGMGKTSFALNIATNVAKSTGKTIAIFSLEMSKEQLVTRVLSSEAMVDSSALRSGNISDEDWKKLSLAATEINRCNILIDDTTGQTVMGMKSKLRRVDNLGLVVIDYLQLMESDKKIENRVQEVSDISRNLKIMAKEFNVPIICCAQLSRATEATKDRKPRKPMLSDLRESGAIEQDADVVMFIYRDYYGEESQSDPQTANLANILIAKNRHGGTNDIQVGWVGQYTKFYTIDKEMQ